MHAITQIGEQGLEHPDGTAVILRPSFRAMASLGEPEEIVEKFSRLHSSPILASVIKSDPLGVRLQCIQVNKTILRDHWREMLFLSHEIITACATDDMRKFIGEPGSRYASYRLGPVPPEVMLVLARSLMAHGIIGPMPKKLDGEVGTPAKSSYTAKFDALFFVYKAVSILGMSEGEAWNMTMSSFAAAWNAKYGENKQERFSEEHDNTMAWLKKVNEKRKPKQ